MTTLKKLEETYSQYQPPIDIEKQFALLFAYRRTLTELLTMEEEIRNLRRLQDEHIMMLQDWILKNKDSEILKTERIWEKENA
jgi:hypothetical protein